MANGAIPSFEEFVSEVKPLNPKASQAELKQAYFDHFKLRQDGTPKGQGYFGELPSTNPAWPKGTVSTELSANSTIDGKDLFYPLLTPNLTRAEIDHLLAGKKPTDAIYSKAIEHAQARIKAGKSPFAGQGERAPLPKAPGLVGSALTR